MTTRVRGQVVFPNTSTPVNGAHVEIRAIGSTTDPSAPAYIPAASAEVFSPYKTAADDFGHWHADLTPSEDLVPVGCLYEIRYRWDGDVHGFYIEVPATPSEVWVGDITVPTNDILTGLRVRDLVGVTITDPQVDEVLGIVDVIDGIEIWGNIAQTGGGGGGSALTVKLNGATVDTAVTDLDFSSQFAATESPAHEINISVVALAASVVTSGTFDVARIPDLSALYDVAGAAAAAQAASQPLDSDLTAIAALTTTAYGRSFLTLADSAAALTLAGAQPSDADLTAIAAIATSVGSLIVGGAGPVWVELPIGANATVLTSDGTTASWQAPAGGGSGVNVELANVAVLAGATTLNYSTAFTVVDAGGGQADIGLDTDLEDLAVQWGRASGALQSKLHFHEITSNGTNRVRLMGPAAVTADVDVLLPDAAGTLLIDANIGSTVQAFSADLVDLIARWIPASSAAPASLDFAEDTDLGTSRIRVTAPASVTADRSHTLPDTADDTFVMLAATQTLTNKTLTAPTIADFTNATHDHLDADDGGALFSTLGAARALHVRDTFSDADKTVTAGTTILAQTGTLTAARTVTLPAASAYVAGSELTIVDESGSVQQTGANNFVLTIQRAGADTIDGLTSHVLGENYGWVTLISDGSSKWTISSQVTYLDVQEFASPGAGTWRKPANALIVLPHLVGAGGSGGSGSLLAAGGNRYGGGGGGGGGVAEPYLPPSALSATETVTVGTGGTGVAGIAGPGPSNGVNGNSGGDTTFGSVCKAGGGSGGGQGGTTGGAGGNGSNTTDRVSSQATVLGFIQLSAATGGSSAISASLAPQGAGGQARLPGAGGAGGGIPAANTEFVGGGSGIVEPGSLAGGTGGAAGGGNGTQGTAVSNTQIQYGTGGGGGGSENTNTAAAGDGAAGRTPGGGGGGGGAGTSGNAAGSSGDGAAGGNGYAIIFTVCGKTT